MRVKTELEQITKKHAWAHQKRMLQCILGDSSMPQDYRTERLQALNDYYQNPGASHQAIYIVKDTARQYLTDQGFDPAELPKCNGNALAQRLVSENIGLIDCCANEALLNPDAKKLLDLTTTTSVASSEAAKAGNYELAASLNKSANILYFAYGAIKGVSNGTVINQITSLYNLTHHIGLRYITEIQAELQGTTLLSAFGAVARGTGLATNQLLDDLFQEAVALKDTIDESMNFILRLSTADPRAWNQLHTVFERFRNLPAETQGEFSGEIIGMLFGPAIIQAAAKITHLDRVVTLMQQWNPISVAGRMLACPEKREAVLQKLKNLLNRGSKKEYGIETMLTADSKIIFRKDFGPKAHPLKGYPAGIDIDHYNIEIHVRANPGTTTERWNKAADYHIVIDQNRHVTDFFKAKGKK